MWDNFIYYGKINQNRDSHKCTDGAFYKENILRNTKKARIQLHSYIRTKQITNSTYMKKQILLT